MGNKNNIFLDEESDPLYDKIITVEEGKRKKWDIVRAHKEGALTLEEVKQLMPTISDDRLLIKVSDIKDAGYGVFANTDFRKGQIITYYRGPVISKTLLEKKKTENVKYITHARQFVPGLLIQIGNVSDDGEWIINPSAELEEDGVGPYINDPREADKINVAFKNLDTRENQDIFISTFKRPGLNMAVTKALINLSKVLPIKINQDDRLIIVVATRAIKRGEELYVYYGETHFDVTKTGIPCSSCSLQNANFEESNCPELKFCDEDCRDNYYHV